MPLNSRDVGNLNQLAASLPASRVVCKQRQYIYLLLSVYQVLVMMRCLYILVLFSCLDISLQRSTTQDDHYVAAVVEYIVDRNVQNNKDNYIRLIAEAAAQAADVVVFPELTLTNQTTSFPVPFYGILKEWPIPALAPDLYDELLVAMSKAARDNKVYLVINVRELMDCTQDTGEYCPERKQYIFNTNVVFDRMGAVIDRYRKINLFGEYAHTPALHPDLGVFTTDFGVTFGHFICFDLMFQVPAVQVVQKMNITDVIFTTMWFSELPYLTAVQIQEAYAYAMDVNFLASGANNVAVGSAGSGIFSGKAGALVSIMPGVPTTRLLVAKVPKVPGQVMGSYPGPIYDKPTDQDGLHLITDPSLPSHVSRPLVQGFQEFRLVDKDVTCTFRVRLNQRNGVNTPRFRAFAYDGTMTYVRREIGTSLCIVVACKGDDVKTCAYKYNSDEENASIEQLEIEMSTKKNDFNTTLQCDNAKYFPVSIRDNKFPLDPQNYTYEVQTVDNLETCSADLENDIDNVSTLQNEILKSVKRKERLFHKITSPQNEIVAFGIYGRIFLKDIDHNKHVSDEDLGKFNQIMDYVYEISDKHK